MKPQHSYICDTQEKKGPCNCEYREIQERIAELKHLVNDLHIKQEFVFGKLKYLLKLIEE